MIVVVFNSFQITTGLLVTVILTRLVSSVRDSDTESGAEAASSPNELRASVEASFGTGLASEIQPVTHVKKKQFKQILKNYEKTRKTSQTSLFDHLLRKKRTEPCHTSRVPSWACPSTIDFLDLGSDHIPRYVKSVKCLCQNCNNNHYRCKGIKYDATVFKTKFDTSQCVNTHGAICIKRIPVIAACKCMPIEDK